MKVRGHFQAAFFQGKNQRYSLKRRRLTPGDDRISFEKI